MEKIICKLGVTTKRQIFIINNKPEVKQKNERICA